MKRLALGDRYNFECIGGACPYTCCAYWKVVIDEKTDRYYRSVPGEYGQFLNEHIDRSKKYPVMVMRDGRCSQLRDDNLCRLYLELGPEHMCRTCRDYPRQHFRAHNIEFDSLTLSCPEAGRLMFSHQEPLRIQEEEIGQGTKTVGDLRRNKEDIAFFNFTYKVFQSAVALLQNRLWPTSVRQRLFLLMLQGVQSCIDAGDMKRAKTVLELFEEPERYADLAQKPVEITDPAAKFRLFQSFLFLFMKSQAQSIDHLMSVLFQDAHRINWQEKQRPEEMEHWMEQMTGEDYEREHEHFLIYCLFRYFMRETDLKDRQLYRRAAFIVSFNQFRHLFESFISARSDQILSFDQRVMTAAILARGVEHTNTTEKVRMFYQKMEEEHLGNLAVLFQVIG